MLASGNSNAQVCANNLLRIVRGEVPFDRLRGLDARNIDKPSNEAAEEINIDARWLLKTYEPRINARDVVITQEDGAQGAFNVTATISQGGE